MSSPEEFEEYAEMIMNDRGLPYTLTIEKIEDGIIFTHNQWGNSVQYVQEKDGTFKLLEKAD